MAHILAENCFACNYFRKVAEKRLEKKGKEKRMVLCVAVVLFSSMHLACITLSLKERFAEVDKN